MATEKSITSHAETNFGAEIFNNISTSATDDNIIISPLLLEATLALLYLGSDGATAEELQMKLQLKQRFASNAKMANYFAAHLANATSNPETKIHLQNKILLHESHAVAEDFHKIAQTYFHISAERINLRGGADKLQQNLNDAIRKITKPTMVDDAGAHFAQLPSTEEAATALLLLAANFQNKWFLPFSAYRSGLYDFHIAGEQQRSAAIPMLFDDDMFVKFGEFRELNARAIELPYEHDDELAMLLILPNARDGLPLLEQQLRQVNLGELQERMQMESVQVLLPKFSIDFECSLRPALKQLGFSEIFSNDANFKNLLAANSNSAPIADVLHKVIIAVHESGSEATSQAQAPLKPIVISNSLNSRQKFFRADHPFFFAIRGGNATYLIGHVVRF